MNHKKDSTLKGYIKEKIRIIEKEFHIPLTLDEKMHMQNLTSETDVDQYAHDIFMRKL